MGRARAALLAAALLSACGGGGAPARCRRAAPSRLTGARDLEMSTRVLWSALQRLASGEADPRPTTATVPAAGASHSKKEAGGSP